MQVAVKLSKQWKPAMVEGMPNVFTGGWVGYCGYDTVRYVYSGKCLSHLIFMRSLTAFLLKSCLPMAPGKTHQPLNI